MKIQGKQLVSRPRIQVQLVRGDDKFTLTLSPLPPAWSERMRSLGLMDYPSPPKKVLKDGARVVRNPDTRMPEVIDDESDPKYRDESLKVSRRVMCLRLAAHLKDDPEIEFEAKEPEGNDRSEWMAYAESLKKEMTDVSTGFTDDEIGTLLDKAESLKTVLDIDRAVDDFLAET